MKIVIPGGSGHMGRVLVPALRERGHDVVVLSRSDAAEGTVRWDGATLGPWAAEIDGADAVVNLAGRSVDCRYHKANLTEMLASRIDSTRVVGEAIAAAARPPRVWLQASTATIYAHTFERDQDEATGEIGGAEPDVPGYWRYSIEIARAWERTLFEADTPATRRVALRTSFLVAPHAEGTFAFLRRLARFGLGGPIAGGRQYMSWVHDQDLVRAVLWLIEHDDIEGVVNIAAPEPLPQRRFMDGLRRAVGAPFGLPATRWMLQLGAAVLSTDPELILKSRRVVPGRLLRSGFRFRFPTWPEAVRDLVARS